MKTQLDVGIICDWLVTYAGSEKVVAEFIKLYPTAELYSVVDFLSDENRAHFNNKKAKTTFIQKLPKAQKKYKNYLPLMPLAIEQLDVSKHDIILSSSHAVSKGVLTGPD
ncbi:glycosyltransferase family 4 protein, partial [Klebsiella pneumoniae]